MNKKPETLIILSPAFAANENDNWLPSQAGLVRALNKLYPSLQIIILSFHFPVTTKKEYNWYGNRVISFSGGMKGKLHSIWLWLRVWKKLKQLKQQCDLIGIFSFFCSESAFIGHYFSKRHSLKHHIWVLGQDAKKENKQVRRIRPEADELVCISDFLQREFQKNHSVRPAHVIPIGINPGSFTGIVTQRAIDLIGAGSLIPLKQYDVFIDVVKMITERLPVLHAMIIGNGPELERLHQKTKELSIEDNIQLAGEKSHSETLQLIQQSKILLHTSAYEGLGVVCLEALYAGTHVISFCKPFDASIPNWHIVQTKEEMAQKAVSLLQDNSTKYTHVAPYLMDDCAAAIMQLFGYKR